MANGRFPRIIKVSPNRKKTTYKIDAKETLLGTGLGHNNRSYEIGYLDIEIGGDNNLYASNVDQVDVYSKKGSKIKSINFGLGVTDLEFDSAGNLFVSMACVWKWDKINEELVEANSTRIIKMSPSGIKSTFHIDTNDTLLGTGLGENYSRGSYEIGYLDIAIDGKDNIYVTNVDKVDVYSQNGSKIKSIYLGLGVTDLDFDSKGNLFVSMARVWKWDDNKNKPVEINTTRIIEVSSTGNTSSFNIETQETMLGTGLGINFTRGSYEIGYLDISIDQSDNIYVTNVDCVDIYSNDGNYIDKINFGFGVTGIDF
jgi:sugar lactone lactonase YvrE